MSEQKDDAANASAGVPAPVGDWTIDPGRSEVEFNTRAMGGLFPVKANFGSFHGSVGIEADGAAHGSIVIDPASVDTKIAKRDAHLRTEDFFDVERYPEMEFRLDAVKHDGAQPVATGILRIRDKEIRISTPVKLERRGELLSATADFVVDHDAAGLGWSKPLMVRKTVKAHVALTLVRSSS